MADDPKDIWVVAEHDGSTPRDVTYEMLEDARKLADSLRVKVCALVLGGPAVPDFARALAEHGADDVHVGRHELLTTYSAEPFVRVIESLCRERRPGTLIVAATPNGQDLAARIAARLDVGLISSCLQFTIGPDKNVQGVKAAYERKVYATMTCSGSTPHIFTFVPGAVGVGQPNKRRKATVAEVSLPAFDSTPTAARTLEFMPADPRTVDLSEADIIVGGGAGVGTTDMFALVQELADALGASVGGTRPAVDQGWILHERQIGQTGKIVSPRLYIAAGISGASLHAMGVKDAEHIVALNSDKNAPIFKLAHLSAVGDLKEVLPLLLDKIKSYRKQQTQKAGNA
jgi:electron transfer flavoprotein alpha subunit